MRITLLLAAVALGGCNTSSTGSITPPPDGPGSPPGDTTPPPDDSNPPQNNPSPPPAASVIGATGYFFSESAAGDRDRTRTAIAMDIVTRPPGTSPTEGDINPKGTMSSGAQIQTVAGLKRDAALSTPEEQIFANDAGDAFLSVRTMSPDLAVGQYISLSAAGAVRGIGVTGNPTQNMPVSGSATFTGEAMVFPTNLTDMKGRTTMQADFAPGGGTISGRIDQIQTAGGGRNPFVLGLDVMLQETPIAGNIFSGGKIGLVMAGTDDAIGTMVSSDYGGGLFGAGADQAGGTFHFEATGVPIPGVQNSTSLEAIGAFHGTRQP